MNPVFTAALELQAFCRSRGWRFCFIGGAIIPRWGNPRATADADLTLLTGFGTEEVFVDALLKSFRARTEDARGVALTRRVVLLEASNAIPLDVALGALPFEERLIERSSDFTLEPGVTLTTCSAEDFVVLKVFAGRVLDWFDVEGVVTRQCGRLDQKLIFRELKPLLELKGTPEAADRLREILRKAQ